MKNNSNSIFKWIKYSPEFSMSDRWALTFFVLMVVAWYAYELLPLAYLKFPKVSVNKFSMLLVCVTFIFAFGTFLRSNFNKCSANRPIWPYWALSIPFIGIGILKGLLYNHLGATYWLEVLAQAGFCISLFYVIMIGRGGDILKKMFPFFLVMFYVAVIIMLSCKGIVMVRDVDDFGEAKEDITRSITSMAYIFRPTMECAPFFFLAACFWRKKLNIVTRILCFASLVPYAYFTVYMFKFRGGVVTLAATVALTLLFLFFQARIFKFLAIAAIIGMVGLYFVGQSSFLDVRDRMIEANEKGGRSHGLADVLEDERYKEASVMLEELSTSELFLGRGYNATYDATYCYGDTGMFWRTAHIGFLSNVLRNGVIFSALYFFVFFFACFRRIYPEESRDGLKVACKCFVIVETIQYLLNPMLAQIYHIGSVLILYLCLGYLWTQREYPQNQMMDGPHWR